MSKNNYIYKFDVELLLLGERKDHVIKCDAMVSQSAREVVTKGDSLLLNQLRQRFPQKNLESLICILDFSSFIENRGNIIKELSKYEEGFELVINELNEDGNETFKKTTIRFKDFLKSNSMSKDCQIYYLNSDSEIYDLMNDVVYFGFDKSESRVELSKLYAYSGTLCSDVNIINSIKFKPGELVVIKDKELTHLVPECITAISMQSLYGHLCTLDNVDKQKLNCFVDAIDSINQEGEIVNFLNDYRECRDNDYVGLSELRKKYESVNSNSKEIYWCPIKVKNFPSKFNMFDGEGFISEEFHKEFLEKAGYENDGPTSLQIRLPYVKGMVHTCNIKKFFDKYGVKEITGIDGDKYPIENVKIILTKSMFKCYKFIQQLNIKETVLWYIDTINKFNYPFGYIKRNPKEKDLVKLQYEYLSTLPLSFEEIEKLIDKHRDYINKNCLEDEIIEALSEKQQLIYKSGESGRDYIINTSAYKDTRNSIFKSQKEDAEFSRFFVQGTQKYLSGDLLELLYFCVSKEFPKDHYLGFGKYYMPSDLDGYNDHAVILRSPHYSRNEIGIALRDNTDKERDEFFGHLKSVVMVNPLSNIPNRIGGADFDGDLAIVIKEHIIVNNVKLKILGKYPVVIIPSLEPNRDKYSYSNKIICCHNTFSSRVGLISNIALKDSVVQYNEVDKTSDNDRIAFYTILNGLEIDSAKNGKKPKLPKHSNDEKVMTPIDYFFAAKKEYTGKGASRSHAKKKLIESIENDEVIANNILKAFKYSLNNISANFKRTRVEPQCFGITTKEHAEILALQHLYSKANSMIGTALSKHGKRNNSKKALAAITLIDQILKGQDITAEEFIDEFQGNLTSYEAYVKLCEYVNNDCKYHFLKAPEDKNRYLNSLNIEFSPKIKQLLTCEKNENYRLLYLGLLCVSKRTNSIHIYEETKGSLLEELKQNKSLYDYYLNYYEENRLEIESYLNEHISDNSNELKKYIIKTIKNKCKKYKNIQIISNVINIYTSSLMFDIFFEQLKSQYIGESKNE